MLLAICMPATASPAGEQPEQDEPPAELNRKAIQLAGEGHFDEAIRIWEGLLTTVPANALPALHKNLGRACQRMGRNNEAWYHLHRAAEVKKTDERLQEWLQRAEQDLEEAGLCPVTIRTTPAPDLLTVDRKEIPLPTRTVRWWAKKGVHHLHAEKTGHGKGTWKVDIRCTGSERIVLEILASEPKGDLPGRQEAPPTTGRASPPEPSGNAWKYAVLGSGVACLAGGTATWFVARSRQKDLDRDFDRRYPGGVFSDAVAADAAQDDYDTRRRRSVLPWTYASYSLWGIGAAAAVTATVFLLIQEDPPAASTTKVEPWVLPAGAGMSLRLGF